MKTYKNRRIQSRSDLGTNIYRWICLHSARANLIANITKWIKVQSWAEWIKVPRRGKMKKHHWWWGHDVNELERRKTKSGFSHSEHTKSFRESQEVVFLPKALSDAIKAVAQLRLCWFWLAGLLNQSRRIFTIAKIDIAVGAEEARNTILLPPLPPRVATAPA